jgi:hypothetical protein
MINTQLFHDAILILAVLIAMTLALTGTMMLAARSVRGQGRPPRGGNRRGLPQDPQPEPDGIRELVPDDIRDLVPDDISQLVPDDVRELVPDGGRELVLR